MPPVSKKAGHTSTKPPFRAPQNHLQPGLYALTWLLHPHTPQQFFSSIFEQKPVLLRHKTPRFNSLISTRQLKLKINSKTLTYSTEIDVTSYTESTGRSTHNRPGEKAGAEAWDGYMKGGCSIRLRRPQDAFPGIRELCSLLEGYVQCMVGANVYLTPCNSQGFAPHFDDVDAFICQISGRKRWRVYGKRADGNDVLPRASSIDFDRDDMKGCEVIIDTVLTPGDMLYLPRGAIHEAFCVKGETEEVLEGGSLHVTISMFQRWTWADFLLTTFERAVRTAALEDVALRRTLPVRFGEFFGVANVGKDPKMRKAFEKDLANMVASVGKEYPTDVAADMMMSKFMSTRIAPKKRKPRSVQSESFVRGVCEGVARIVMDDDGVPKLIHCIGNKPGEEAVNGVSCLPEEALAVDQILESGRGGLRVGDLQLEDEDSVTLVDGLVEMGIVEVVAQPEQNGTPLRKKRRR